MQEILFKEKTHFDLENSRKISSMAQINPLGDEAPSINFLRFNIQSLTVLALVQYIRTDGNSK